MLVVVLMLLNCDDKKGQNSKITVFSSTVEEQWKFSKYEVNSMKSNSDYSSLLEIKPDIKFQVIDGFGGCFNELGWKAVQYLNPKDQKHIIADLFDTIEGCAFNICRMPIGASDFALNWYSLNDTPGDFKMENFTIERDKERLIPYIKSAMKYNPKLKVWGSPWSPPVWMKENNAYNCNGKDARMKWEPEILKAHALYLSKYIEAYQDEGINVYAVHFQNEVAACQEFPSCLWTSEEQRDYIKYYLGPHFESNKIDAEIWLGTINKGDYENTAKIVLSDSAAKSYITGVGYQWEGKKSVRSTHEDFPDIKIMQTETECGDGSNDWLYAEHTYDLMNWYFKRGANSYMQWNMILDETSMSSWGWKQSAMITVNRKNRTYRLNPQYYIAKHFSRFIHAGAQRIDLGGDADYALAFKNPAGDIVVITRNPKDSPKKQTIKIGDKGIELMLNASSVNTVLIPSQMTQNINNDYVTEEYKLPIENYSQNGSYGVKIGHHMDKGNVLEYDLKVHKEGNYSIAINKKSNCDEAENIRLSANGEIANNMHFKMNKNKHLFLYNIFLNKSINYLEIATDNQCLELKPVKIRYYDDLIYKSSGPIYIDGILEKEWDGAANVYFADYSNGRENNAIDKDNYMKYMWDDKGLTLFFSIMDDNKYFVENDPLKGDAIELFLDIGNEKSPVYDENDFQFIFSLNGNDVWEQHGNQHLLKVATNVPDYKTSNFEVRIDWESLNSKPDIYDEIGIGIVYNDFDKNPDKDKLHKRQLGIFLENDHNNNAWNDPRLFGTLFLTND
jgi:glucosylceramidase